MRSPATPQSLARYPLSSILATEGAVRVLRELIRAGSEIDPPALAEMVRMSPQQVRQILGWLREVGVVESVGTGRYRSYRAQRRYPLYEPLAALFRAEAERFEEVVEALRRAGRAVTPAPVAMWVYGSVARGEDNAQSKLEVALVADEAGLDPLLAQVREQLGEAEARLGIQSSVVGLTTEDVLRLSSVERLWRNLVADAIPLSGLDPEALVRRVREEGGARAGARPSA